MGFRYGQAVFILVTMLYLACGEHEAFRFSFATPEIMSQYGEALENFEENSDELNDCILTVMHHVAGDCERPDLLLQFSIVRKMSELAGESYLSVVREATCFLSRLSCQLQE